MTEVKMLRNKRGSKRLATITAIVIILMASMALSSYGADSIVIHEKTEKQIITNGVTLENIIKFTVDGWYNFNILRVDLSNKFLSVDALTNRESVGKTASTNKLAAQRDAVAAVNASFFSPTGSGNAYPVGTVIQSSDILCAYSGVNRYSNSMASFSISNLNKVTLDYWKVDMNLSSQSGARVGVEQYNTANKDYYSDINVFDRKWSSTAIGATDDMPDIFQMVVVNGIITQFLDRQPAAMIPENGFVTVTRSSGAKKLREAFSVGDRIKLNIGSSPDWAKLKMSVSGSSILIKDGVIPEKFSFAPADIVAKSPKTAIGSSKDGNTLYMVTVDGRQTASIGLTLNDMALFMQSIGAYNAVNMDGGGSTTIAARPVGSTDVKVMNRPSDGTTRNVPVGIGVFTSAPEAPLAGLIIETADRYIFTNATRAFTVKGFDRYNNPMEVDPSLVKWSVSGVKGTFEGNVFRPTTYGEGKITAKIGSTTATRNISVLSKPAVIALGSDSIKLPVGQSTTFSVKGVNPRGYTATIEPADLKWKVSSKVGTFTDGVFTATDSGAGFIDASFGDVHAYCAVSVSADTVSVVDNFEKLNGAFLSYPGTISGDYSISGEQKVSGNYAGRLIYDFTTNTNVTRAAYLVFPNGRHTLNEGTSKIGLQVYNDHENPGWLRAEIMDSDGVRQVVDLSRTMDWTSWKYVDAPVENIKMPAKLTRIYQALVNPEGGEQLADAGCLYFDELTFTTSNYPTLDGIEIPDNTPFIDEAYKAVSFSKATNNSFRFGVMGQSRKPDNSAETNLIKIFANKVTKYLELGAVVGAGSHETITNLIGKKPVIATHTVDLKSTKATDYKYSVTDFKNSRFIKLDTRKNSLRLSDTEQWSQFLNDLKSFKGKNVFILMENSPETFTDKLELALFKETISDYRLDTLRNVWVFYKGSKNGAHMEKGVKYIETAGYEASGLKSGKTDPARYVLVTVKGSTVTYIFKEIDS